MLQRKRATLVVQLMKHFYRLARLLQLLHGSEPCLLRCMQLLQLLHAFTVTAAAAAAG
jgi:hypothetical protein